MNWMSLHYSMVWCHDVKASQLWIWIWRTSIFHFQRCLDMEGLYTQPGQEAGRDISERRSGHSRMSADTCEFLHQTKHSNQDHYLSTLSVIQSQDICRYCTSFYTDKFVIIFVVIFNFMGSFINVIMVYFVTVCCYITLVWIVLRALFNEMPTPPSHWAQNSFENPSWCFLHDDGSLCRHWLLTKLGPVASLWCVWTGKQEKGTKLDIWSRFCTKMSSSIPIINTQLQRVTFVNI